MHEDLDFVIESGTKKPADITIYALSTCGFCRSALNFLRENDIAFKYIYVDKQSSQVKVQIKKDLRDNFEERLGFPYSVINGGEKVMVGFKTEKWEKAFLT